MTEKEKKKEQRLGWKDYVAIVIAMLTTTLLPIVILVFILLAVVIFAVAHFR